MAKALVLMMCPAGIALALLPRYARAVPADPAAHRDVPERLLRWAAGLLSARREEWGQAAAAVWAVVVAAAGAAGVYAAVAVRYRVGAGGWVFAVITLVFLAGFTLAVATLLRRPGVALPGLGGLVVALTWLALSGSPSTGSSPR